LDILVASESILRKISNIQSKSVRLLAEKIKQSFLHIRKLLQRYEENLDKVDPQLKNNKGLVKVLEEFENYWEKGKNFFLNSKKCHQLVHFSQIIESVCEKFSDFKTKIESMDSEIFILIPCLLLLNALEGDDRKLCQSYYPELLSDSVNGKLYKEIKQKYEHVKFISTDPFNLYNNIERFIMEKSNISKNLKMKKEDIEELVHSIKILALNMQRFNPLEWNSMLEIVILRYK